jgi:hypothetical protein
MSQPIAATARTHPVRCRCGSLAGELERGGALNRCICYCRSCQTFARVLGREHEILDAQGGTDIVQARTSALSFTQGSEQLACVRLSERGPLRWYARCCNTGIGNTPADWRVAIVGLVHDSLRSAGAPPLTTAFGAVAMRVHTRDARNPPAPRGSSQLRLVARLAPAVLRARMGGSYRRTPFFDAAGRPIAAPRVLSAGERAASPA